ncbi:MAG: hypothetical protein H6R00_468 [Proteobacteria bacterium]|nr:hypothetical protein [Pseudomonadota bacterium]
MNTDNPVAGDLVSLIAKAGTVGENADVAMRRLPTLFALAPPEAIAT